MSYYYLDIETGVIRATFDNIDLISIDPSINDQVYNVGVWYNRQSTDYRYIYHSTDYMLTSGGWRPVEGVFNEFEISIDGAELRDFKSRGSSESNYGIEGFSILNNFISRQEPYWFAQNGGEYRAETSFISSDGTPYEIFRDDGYIISKFNFSLPISAPVPAFDFNAEFYPDLISPEIEYLILPYHKWGRHLVQFGEGSISLLNADDEVVSEIRPIGNELSFVDITLEENKKYSLVVESEDYLLAGGEKQDFTIEFETSPYALDWQLLDLQINQTDITSSPIVDDRHILTGEILVVESVTGNLKPVTLVGEQYSLAEHEIEFEIFENTWKLSIPVGIISEDKKFEIDLSHVFEIQSDSQTNELKLELFANEPPMRINYDWSLYDGDYNAIVTEVVKPIESDIIETVFSEEYLSNEFSLTLDIGKFDDINNSVDEIFVSKLILDNIEYSDTDFSQSNYLGAIVVRFDDHEMIQRIEEANQDTLNVVVSDGTNSSVLDYSLQLQMNREIEVFDDIFEATSWHDRVIFRGENSLLRSGSGDDEVFYAASKGKVELSSGYDKVYVLESSKTWSDAYVAKNTGNSGQVGTDERVQISGKLRYDFVISGESDALQSNSVYFTNKDDAVFLDDVFSSAYQDEAQLKRLTGIDYIHTGDGDDIVDLTSNRFEDSGGVRIYGGLGNDILWGGLGDDFIYGDGFYNSFFSSVVKNVGDLYESGVNTGQNDVLFGGGGSNNLFGGPGADEFQFTRTSKNDYVGDFSIAQGDTLKFFNTGGAVFDRESIALNSAGDELSIAYGSGEDDTLTISLRDAGLQLGDLTDDVLIIV